MNILHIHCGDCSADILRQSGVAGDILVWREIYTEGPVPGLVSHDEFCRVRARFLSTFGLAYDEILRSTDERYNVLAHAGTYDEILLWFDACMFDQFIMIHLIDHLGTQAGHTTKLSLICIDERGLGELLPDEMAALMNVRQPITSQQIHLAHDAWQAFVFKTPYAIESFLLRDSRALPHLGPAFRRHLQQFPSTRNGLNRTQNQALDAVGAGHTKLRDIFRYVSSCEEQRFLGDTSLWAILAEMSEGDSPLLSIDGPGPIVRPVHHPLTNIERWTVTLTDCGQKVQR